MLRLGILPEGYFYPKETRPIRDLLRKRKMLVQHRTAYKLSPQNMINRNKGLKLNANGVRKLTNEVITDMFADEHHVMAVRCDNEVIDFLSKRIDRIEKVVIKQVRVR